MHRFISINDTDGEFLLIEAAEHLPSWVTPSNAYNRVSNKPSTLLTQRLINAGLDL